MARPLILVSNDDGIEAPGLKALVAALEEGDGEVWTVAPDSERSTSSHCLSLRDPVPVKRVDERVFAVNGWPADCVYLGMFGLLPRRPDVVVSGINRGANMGTDVLYSGTVGAAREAFTRGVTALAISLVHDHDYTLAARFSAALTNQLCNGGNPPFLLNINVPGSTAKGVKVVRLGERYYPERVEPAGIRDGWELYQIGGGLLRDGLIPGSDGEAIEQGYISVTPLSIDSTATTQLEPARDVAGYAWERFANDGVDFQ